MRHLPPIYWLATFPEAHGRQIWSKKRQERLIREIRLRIDMVAIFYSRQAIIRLVGAVVAKQKIQWSVARSYRSLASLRVVHMIEQSNKEGEQPAASKLGQFTFSYNILPDMTGAGDKYGTGN